MKSCVGIIVTCILVNFCHAGPVARPASEVDQVGSDSYVHYDYGRHYGYGGYHQPVAPVHHVHHAHAVVPAYGHATHGYGYQHKHGYHHNDGLYHDYGYEKEVKHGHHLNALPVYTGFVPAYGLPGVHDHAEGYAIGHDALGHFDHYTGPFGPFGFYANFYHD